MAFRNDSPPQNAPFLFTTGTVQRSLLIPSSHLTDSRTTQFNEPGVCGTPSRLFLAISAGVWESPREATLMHDNHCSQGAQRLDRAEVQMGNYSTMCSALCNRDTEPERFTKVILILNKSHLYP